MSHIETSARVIPNYSFPSRVLVFLSTIAATLGAVPLVAAQQTPFVMLDNGSLRMKVYLPDAEHGFYRGSRFDWSGMIGDLTFAGNHLYGPWFSRVDPAVHDFIFKDPGDEIISGEASAATGPAEEFQGDDGTPLGFNATLPGGTFVKIGVGVLRRPDAARYDAFRPYDIVDHGIWRVRTKFRSVTFMQRVVDPRSGYGYLYTKTILLRRGKPVFVIRHSLKNLGRLPIQTQLYDHNFLVVNHLPIGPDFRVILPFAIHPERPIKQELGQIDGNLILYRRTLIGSDRFTVHIAGFSTSAKDYDFRVENRKAGIGIQVTGDRALASEELWSIRSVLAFEPYLNLTIPTGKSMHWAYTYRYYRP